MFDPSQSGASLPLEGAYKEEGRLERRSKVEWMRTDRKAKSTFHPSFSILHFHFAKTSASLPRMFSIPSLGILSTPSSESITFKTDKVRGLARLYSEPVPESDHRFYSSLLLHFTSAAHAFDTFSIKDARAIRDRQPQNLKTVVRLLTAHLESLKRDEEFAIQSDDGEAAGLMGLGKWVAAPLSPFAAAFGGNNKSSVTADQHRNRTREALNCARLLSRLIPVLMEAPSSDSVGDKGHPSTSMLEEDVLWSREALLLANSTQAEDASKRPELVKNKSESSEEAQFVIDDDDASGRSPNTINEDSKDPLKSESVDVAPDLPTVASPALAERLCALCIDFLFFPGFTLPSLPEDDDTGSPDDSRVHFAIWEKGVGSSVSLPNTTKEHLAHRVEFLRLFVVLLSKTMYLPPAAQRSFTDRSLQFVCTSLSRTVTLPVLCSLLNTACSPSAGAWGLSSFTGQQEPDVKEVLRAISLQILVTLLEWTPSNAVEGKPEAVKDSKPTESAPLDAATDASPNQFSHWLSKIHRGADIEMLSTSLMTALRPTGSAMVSFHLPGSSVNQQGINAHAPETMTLLWHLLRSNTRFRAMSLDDSERCLSLVSLLLSQALLCKDSPPVHGMVRLSLFILQDISASPNLAAHLAKPGSASNCKLPAKFSGLTNGASSAADILVGASVALLTTKGMGSGGLGVQPVVLITLANVAPHLSSLSISSSTRLSLLFAQFTNATFLLGDEGHPRSLYFLLEALNAMLLRPGPANYNLVYSILSKHQEVNRLRNFTLRRGLSEIRRRSGLAGVNAVAQTPVTSPGKGEAGASTTSLPGTATTLPSAEQEKGKLAAKDEQEQAFADDGPLTEGEEIKTPTFPSEKALGKVRRISAASEEPSRLDQQQNASAVPRSESTTSLNPTSTPAEAQSSDDWVDRLDEDELYEAARRVGKNGFVPTQAWVQSWLAGLPLQPLIRLQEKLLPEMEALCASEAVANKADAEQRAMAWLREQDVKKVLDADEPDKDRPVPQARPFVWTDQVTVWLLSYIMGAIYVMSLPYTLFPEDSMRLFAIKEPDQR